METILSVVLLGGKLLILLFVLLSPVFFFASWFYPKEEDGHYRLEKWIPLETSTLKKTFRRLGWIGLSLAVILLLWSSVIID
jgi:hypothetical protein